MKSVVLINFILSVMINLRRSCAHCCTTCSCPGLSAALKHARNSYTKSKTLDSDVDNALGQQPVVNTQKV